MVIENTMNAEPRPFLINVTLAERKQAARFVTEISQGRTRAETAAYFRTTPIYVSFAKGMTKGVMGTQLCPAYIIRQILDIYMGAIA